jgi:ABC-type polysaccharide/polyol phosphate export permease
MTTSLVREVWSARPLLRQLVLRDLRVRYKQAFFGLAWAVFMPALIVLSGVLVRFAISQVGSAPFDRAVVGTLALKGLAWGFFVAAVGVATPSLTGNSNLVTKVYFPRAVLPLATILAQTVDTAIACTAFVVLSPLVGLTWSVQMLWLPVLAALIFCFTTACGLLLGAANVYFRDVKYIVQTLLTFGIFFTPVFFEPAMLGELGARLIMLNPLAPLIEGLRLALIEGHNLLTPLSAPVSSGTAVVWSPAYLGYSVVWALGGLIVSIRIFRRAEPSFPEYV